MLHKAKILFFPCKENQFLPLFLKPKFLTFYFLFLLFLKFLIVPLTFFVFKTNFFAQISKTLLIELINQERAKMNLPPLKENSLLEQSAFMKAQDIIQKDYFAHYSPEGTSPWYWFKVAGYDFEVAGENLAIGFIDAKEVVQAWMNSPSHRKNILNPKYQEMGIAILKGEFQGNEVYLIVQHLASPKIAKSEAKSLPPKDSISSPSFKIEKETSSIVATSEFNLATTEMEIAKSSQTKISFNFLKFLLKHYLGIVNFFLYLTLLFLLFSLTLTIYFDIFVWRRFVLDYKYLIPYWLSFFGLLIFFLWLDQPKIVQIIPHTLRIYE